MTSKRLPVRFHISLVGRWDAKAFFELRSHELGFIDSKNGL